jgi:hypothetical protein
MTAVYYLQGNRRNAKKEEPPAPNQEVMPLC